MIEHDKALVRMMTAFLKDEDEVFKLLADNEPLPRSLADYVFASTYSVADQAFCDGLISTVTPAR